MIEPTWTSDCGTVRLWLADCLEVEVHAEAIVTDPPDPYCKKVLAKHWPDVPRWDDVRTFPPEGDWDVDVICGGFPCQDISICGKGAGIEGDKSGLWREMLRVIQTVSPRYAVIENVPAITHRGLDRVLGDIASIGFDAKWQTISAWAFGSHHKRERMYIVANRSDTDSVRWEGWAHAMSGPWSHSEFTGLVRGVLQLAVPAGKRGRVSDGVPSRVDRLRGLGNAVVPQISEWIGRRIVEANE
jgi:DNA (cytosine-5)-methyltransferase 1